jgi:flavin-dependent dehydrogenase
MADFDVVVVGGSVAGSITARELGRRGRRVALYEKERFPRWKSCGETLLPQGVAALQEMGLDYAGPRIRGVRFVSPSGHSAEADFPGGQGLAVRRDRFDEFLFRAAAETPNVTVFEGTEWTPGLASGKWIVGADGLSSSFHEREEFPSATPATKRIGISTHAKGLTADRDRVEILLQPGGEVVIAPSEGDEVALSCFFRREDLPEGKTDEDRLMNFLLSLDIMKGRTHGLTFTSPCLAVSPLGMKAGAMICEQTLLVGDAAGAPDPITMEGLALSILSARVAAKAIANEIPEEYERERYRLAVGSEWLGRWILRAARYPDVADRVVESLAKHPNLLRRLLEISAGTKSEGDFSLLELAQLVV